MPRIRYASFFLLCLPLLSMLGASPAQAQTGSVVAYTVLEVGDPVVFFFLTVKLSGVVYHPQDLVFLSWFSRQAPSQAVSGYYDPTNQVGTFSEPCPDSTQHAFTTFDVPSATRTMPQGINNRGEIVGLYRDAGGRFTVFCATAALS
jgi:hypothetical protein